MQQRTVPPAAIGLAAGVATTAVAVALNATGFLPAWIAATLLLFVGGLAAGLAAPVRPATGAVLGAATGVFAGVFQAVVAVILWTPVPNQYITPPPLVPIALALVIISAPVYAVAGAVGAAVRPLLMPRPSSVERVRGLTPERRQLAGIAAGALIIVVPLGLAPVAGSRAGLYLDGNTLTVLFLVSGLAGGFAAGIFSPGGARAGVGSGLLAGAFGIGVIALYFIWQASTRATGDGVPEGLWPIALAIMAFWVLPAAALGGALGGSFRRPSGASPEPEL